jgi:hypothetical protein
MKRILILLSAVLLFAGCGTGTHTVVSGKADEAAVVFFAESSQSIDVTIDGKAYQVKTVKDTEYKAKRDIKRTAENSIVVSPGQHDVKVTRRGETVLTQKIFVSAGEIKVIKL